MSKCARCNAYFEKIKQMEKENKAIAEERDTLRKRVNVYENGTVYEKITDCILSVMRRESE